MEIYDLYKIIKVWEIALTLTKPKEITRIFVSPIINDDLLSIGEGEMYSYLKICVEAGDKYEDLMIGWHVIPYKGTLERKEAEEKQISYLAGLIEYRMNNNYINNFWKNFPQDLDWKPLL
jgi:hypothetical protein